jgi:hypothetical protein
LVTKLPAADTGLISLVGTRVEIPEWKPVKARDPAKKSYVGCELYCPRGFRLSGFEIVCPKTPADTEQSTAVFLRAGGNVQVEGCRVIPNPQDPAPPLGFDANDFRALAVTQASRETPTHVLLERNSFERQVAFDVLFPWPLVIRQNRFLGGPSALWLPQHAGEVIVQQNIIQGYAGITFAHREPGHERKMSTGLIANNVFDVTDAAIRFEPLAGKVRDGAPLPHKLRIQNNVIQSRMGNGINLPKEELAQVRSTWQVGHNCYETEPGSIGNADAAFPRQPTDVKLKVQFLSADPKNIDYFRIAAESPLATKGVGGDLPRYIGLFPPGAAPREGDEAATGPIKQVVGQVRRMNLNSRVYSVAISPNGRLALSGSQDGTARLWDLATGTELARFPGHDGIVQSVAFSPDGRLALTAGAWASGSNFDIRLWEVATRKEIRRLTGHTNTVFTAAFSPDSTKVISGAYDGVARVWNAETGRVIHKLACKPEGVWCVAFSPDASKALIGTGVDNIVHLWDLETGKELDGFKGHTGSVVTVAFSTDGSKVLSAGYDKTMRLWDVATRKELKQFSGHLTIVLGVALTRDGRWAISGTGGQPKGGAFIEDGGSDSALHIWDVKTGKEIQVLEGHTLPVHSFALAPDGRHLLSGSFDGTMRWWRLPEAPAGK